MEIILNNSLFIGSVILLLSVVLSKSSSKFGLPILVFFMFVGMVAGNEGIGAIEYENYELTHSLSLVAICIIIFSGGLGTKLNEARPVLKSGASLATLGVLFTAGFIALFAKHLFEITWIEALLLGSILSCTDAAAVFSIFRDKNSQVLKRLKSTVELESGSNDPMAYFLVTFFLGLYQNQSADFASVAAFVVLNPLVGLIGGFGVFKLFQLVNSRLELDFQGLYPALTLGFLFLTFSSVSIVEGNGFLAVYIFGIMLGNEKIAHRNSLLTFFDGTSWLFQIGLFVLLGLLVFPSRLVEVAPLAIGLALFILFIARPLAVFLSLALAKNFSSKDKLFISWAGLKGATPIVFASLAATKLGENSLLIFDVVFFSVLISALFQGSTVRPLARRFGLLFEAIYDPEFPIDREVLEKTRNGIREYRLEDDDFAVGKKIVDLELPTGARVLFIKRASQFIIPDGATVFEAADRILMVTNEKHELDDCVLSLRQALESQSLSPKATDKAGEQIRTEFEKAG